MIRLALLTALLTGCTLRTVDTNEAVIDTRGVPIVQVVIEGPGGDLVPVDHWVVQEQVMVPWPTEVNIVAACMVILVCVFGLVVELTKRGRRA